MNKVEKICVVGLGYIGLPTAALLASRGLNVIGLEINQQVVDTINSGKIHIVEPELDVMVHGAVNVGNLRATTIPEEADIFVIAVPTPITKDKKPDITYVESATKNIAKVLKQGCLVIIESTSPVGTTEKVGQWLQEERTDLSMPKTFGEAGDIDLAYCPERVLPGQIIRELVENDRVVGGINEQSTTRAIEFYKLFVQGECVPTNARTAEMTKLTENAFRDVNIAFANELSMICDDEKIDVWELIRLANRHPRVNILQPGPGVGGHCIAVDPWFIVANNTEKANVIRAAREVNDQKTDYIIEKIRQSACEFHNPKIACLGITFKKDIDDLRESPALKIVEELGKDNLEIHVVEPHIRALPRRLSTYPNIKLATLEEAMTTADIIVVLVNHTCFQGEIVSSTKKIIDPCGAGYLNTPVGIKNIVTENMEL